MTIPTNAGLQTALSGLQAYQAALDTTGENIANASTPGYSRQRVVLGESNPLTVQALSTNTGAGSQVGTGVSIDDISRIRDQFLDTQYRTQNANSSYQSTLASELGQAQTAVNEPSTSGIGAALTSFWSAWGTLSKNPGSSGAEQGVVSAGQTLAATINAVSSQISTVGQQAGAQYASLTQAGGKVQQDAQTIATLNQQISAQEQSGLTPNNLLDQRDAAIDDLSSLASVKVTNDTSDAGVSVTFGNSSTPLVSGATAATWPMPTLGASPGGTLQALSELSSTTSGPIAGLTTQLNGVAGQVMSQVNTALGSNFFSASDPTNPAATIQVAAGVSAGSLATVTPTTAQSISDSSTQSGSSDDLYSAFVGQVGSLVQQAQNASSTASAVLGAVSNQRQSVSGVSLDEEMSNLITFQQGYQASARMMNTLDSVINTLINTVGGA